MDAEMEIVRLAADGQRAARLDQERGALAAFGRRLLQTHSLRFTHVRGHAGHAENERCDALAVAAYQKFL